MDGILGSVSSNSLVDVAMMTRTGVYRSALDKIANTVHYCLHYDHILPSLLSNISSQIGLGRIWLSRTLSKALSVNITLTVVRPPGIDQAS